MGDVTKNRLRFPGMRKHRNILCQSIAITAGILGIVSKSSGENITGGIVMSELLGRRLRALRRLKRLTQQDLSVRLGVSVSTLSTIEKGEKYPSAELLKKIARVLDVSSDELFVLPDVLPD